MSSIEKEIFGREPGKIPESEWVQVFHHPHGESYEEVNRLIECKKRELKGKYGHCEGVLFVIIKKYSR